VTGMQSAIAMIVVGFVRYMAKNHHDHGTWHPSG